MDTKSAAGVVGWVVLALSMVSVPNAWAMPDVAVPADTNVLAGAVVAADWRVAVPCDHYIPATAPIAKGWPLALPGGVVGTPTPADLDGDGDLEVVVACAAGQTDFLGRMQRLVHPVASEHALLFAFHHDGTAVTGWPAVLMSKQELQAGAALGQAGGWESSPAIVDLDADGRDDVAINTPYRLSAVLVRSNGQVTHLSQRGHPWTTAAVADINGDGRWDIVGGSMLFVTQDDRPIPGWGGERFAPPAGFSSAVGDVDGDGYPEVFSSSFTPPGIIAGQDRFGECLPGWPQKVCTHCRPAPVLGDVNGDGKLDVVAHSGSYLQIWTGDGASMPSTVDLEGKYSAIFKGYPDAGEPILADLDGDGAAEILTVSREGHRLFAWHGDGRGVISTNGFVFELPVRYPGRDIAVADLGGDGVMDLFVAGYWIKMNLNGQVEATAMYDGPAQTVSGATITDLTGDGQAEVLFGLGDGRVVVYETGKAYRKEWMQWPTPHANFKRTRAWHDPRRGALAEKLAPVSQPMWPEVVDLQVKDDRTGAPLEASLSVRVNEALSSVQCNTDGCYRVSVPSNTVLLAVTATVPGYVPRQIVWERHRPLPARYELALMRGATIGGVLQRADGGPASNTTVYITVAAPAVAAGQPRSVLRECPVRSDASGHWTCAGIPEDALWISVRCGKVDGPALGDPGRSKRFSLAQLKAHECVLVVESALKIDGTVLDPDGKPVTGARVMEAHRNSGDAEHVAFVDGDGRFRLSIDGGAREHGVTLSVRADGFVEAQCYASLAPTSAPVEVKLERARLFKIRVIDGRGLPVEGASVDVINLGFGVLRKDRTDSDGRFVCSNAPSMPMRVDLYKRGYCSRWGEVFATTGELCTITMFREARFSGRVTDRVTGAPVSTFQIVAGRTWNTETNWEWRLACTNAGADGAYEFGLGESACEAQLRVVAPGYESAMSRVFRREEEGGVCDFVLACALMMDRRVLDAVTGQPLAGVNVAVVNADARLNWHDAPEQPALAEHLMSFAGTKVRTQPDGSFALGVSDLTGAEAVVLFRPGTNFAYFACRDMLRETGRVDVLFPSAGRVEGIVQLAGQRIADAPVELSWAPAGHDRDGYRELNRWPFRYSKETRTDADGRFAFGAVAPGRYRLRRHIRLGTELRPLAGDYVMVEAGKSTVLDLQQHEGATLRGRIVGGRGNPISGAFVSVTDTNAAVDPMAMVLSGPSGEFAISNLPPGALEMAACKYSEWGGSPMSSRQSVDPAITNDVTVVLRAWDDGILEQEALRSPRPAVDGATSGRQTIKKAE